MAVINYATRAARRRIRPRRDLCQICGHAPATRKILYGGAQGLTAACSKKMHDLTSLERRKVRHEFSRKKWANKILSTKDPTKTFDLPRTGQLIKNTYAKVKSAVTRGDR